MECEAGGIESARGVADTQHVEIPLQHSILTWIAVNDDKCQIKVDCLTLVGHREIATIHRSVLLSVQPVPTTTVDNNLIDIVLRMVQLAIHLVSTGDADIVFTTETTHDKSYILLHL